MVGMSVTQYCKKLKTNPIDGIFTYKISAEICMESHLVLFLQLYEWPWKVAIIVYHYPSMTFYTMEHKSKAYL